MGGAGPYEQNAPGHGEPLQARCLERRERLERRNETPQLESRAAACDIRVMRGRHAPRYCIRRGRLADDSRVSEAGEHLPDALVAAKLVALLASRLEGPADRGADVVLRAIVRGAG